MIEDGTKFLGVDSSVPTPENRSSQANGLSSMVTIEEIAEKVGNINGYTETIVDISSAQILAMGTTPIELLPAAGVGMYYDIDKIIIESEGTDNYVFDAGSYLQIYGGEYNSYTRSQILKPLDYDGKAVAFPKRDMSTYLSQENYGMVGVGGISEVLQITYYSDSGITPNPTLGNGTLRVKIYHKTITFGA
jgi:hypothetical protein